MMTHLKTVVIRMGAELHAQLKKEAKGLGVSMNCICLNKLELPPNGEEIARTSIAVKIARLRQALEELEAK